MENRTEIELMAELVGGQRRSLRQARITSIVCIAIAALIVLLAIIILPKAAAVMDQLDGTIVKLENAMDTLDSLGGTLSKVEGAMDTLDSLGSTLDTLNGAMEHLDGFIENAEALSKAASELGDLNINTLNEGIRKINQIDFEKLNKAINDLAGIIQPLADFFKAFG